MRYISPIANYTILTRDGSVATQGGQPLKFVNGVLVVGSLTCSYPLATNSIVATPTSNISSDIMLHYSTDLQGFTTGACAEMAGQGSLACKTYALTAAGTALLPSTHGYRGMFFPAPVLTATTDVVEVSTATDTYRYEVLSGTVTYAGVTYGVNTDAGQYFTSDTSTTATTGTGTFALTFPTSIDAGTDQYQTEAFAIAHLGNATDVTGYYHPEQDFIPTDSLVSTDDTYFAGIR